MSQRINSDKNGFQNKVEDGGYRKARQRVQAVGAEVFN
jgi:hypothetical protein